MAIVREHAAPIDLLLTDVVMPGQSGRELSANVLERSPGTRVLFMSGYSQDLMFHQGVLDEGVRLITKPFAADDLLRTVREALDGDS
jgi:FixJ family two-component response regulator